MWNGNNGVDYADPTGFDATAQGQDGSGGSDSDAESFNDMQDAIGSSKDGTSVIAADPGMNADSAIDAAADKLNKDYASSPNSPGPHHGHERGSIIVKDDTTGAIYGVPLGPDQGWGTGAKGNFDPADDAPTPPAGTEIVAYWHAHPADNADHNDLSPRYTMIDHPQEVDMFHHPIYTGFADHPGVLFVQRKSTGPPDLIRGSLPYDPTDIYYGPGH
jgi:hypothetical protein